MPTTFLFEVAVLQVANKGQHTNSVEKYIRNEKYEGTQINLRTTLMKKHICYISTLQCDIA